MNKTSKHLTVMAIIAIITLALAFTACKDKPDDPPPPQPHQSTITTDSGKNITVTGDASISTADFNAAVGKLKEVLDYLEDNATNFNKTTKGKFDAMMTKTITIVAGNVNPVIVGGALTVGVNYLNSNEYGVIANTIYGVLIIS